MAVQKLIDGATGTVDGSTVQSFQDKQKSQYGVFQAEITDTATVKLQGRVSPGAPWVDVTSLTASGAEVVTLFPEMRGKVSSHSAGTVNAWLKD